MCGRFTLTVAHLADVAEVIGATLSTELAAMYRPRFNVAPTNRHYIVRPAGGSRELVSAAWGLVPHFAKDRSIGHKLINARSESVAEKPAFRVAFRTNRCVVPADGFYEWTGPKSARQPMWFHAEDRAILWLAGLSATWTEPSTGEVHRTFAIVTTPANDVVRPVHDRMPAVLALPDIARWLDGPDPAALLVPARHALLVASPASRRLNSPRHDDPQLLDPDDPWLRSVPVDSAQSETAAVASAQMDGAEPDRQRSLF
ncbi:MAG: SOS response-associated peptidase [Myxococcales bacterium]|nr:SOS response-associated peptidase [Myxococcales bacterium]